jgi:hypothetical protein
MGPPHVKAIALDRSQVSKFITIIDKYQETVSNISTKTPSNM